MFVTPLWSSPCVDESQQQLSVLASRNVGVGAGPLHSGSCAPEL